MEVPIQDNGNMVNPMDGVNMKSMIGISYNIYFSYLEGTVIILTYLFSGKMDIYIEKVLM